MNAGKSTNGSRDIEPLEPRLLLAADPYPLLKDINPSGDAVAFTSPYWSMGYYGPQSDGVAFKGKTYFTADDGVHGYELWASDGTAAGTQMVADVYPGAYGGMPVSLLVHDDELYFSAQYKSFSGLNQRVVFKTDGTAAGTVRITSKDGEYRVLGYDNPQVLFEYQGKVAFFGSRTDTGWVGARVWKTDGTRAGTYAVSPYISQSTSYQPANMTLSGGYLYFTFNLGAGSDSLCRFDGTQWTEVVRGHKPSGLEDLNGSLLFRYDPGNLIPQLWIVDATGPHRIPGLDNIWDIARFGDVAYVSAQRSFGAGGHSLWKTDGTAAGTVNVYGEGQFTLPPHYLTPIGDRLYFVARTAGSGSAAWVTDGTAAGTRMLADPKPGDTSPSTIAPTFTPGPDGNVYFRADTANQGIELFRTDGSAAGTAMVADFMPGGADSQPGPYMTAGGKFFVAAQDPTYGREWRLIATDTVGPAIVSTVFEYQARRAVRITFGEDVSASLDAADLRVVNRATGADLPPAEWALTTSPPGAPTVATLVLPETVPDGNYAVQVNGAGVRDASGNATADASFDFFLLAADANRDRTVNFTDLLALAKNYNQSGKTFADGDFNYDGTVNFADLLILAKAYNTSLPAPAPAPAAAFASSPTVTAPVQSIVKDEQTPVFSTRRVVPPTPAPAKPKPNPAARPGAR